MKFGYVVEAKEHNFLQVTVCKNSARNSACKLDNFRTTNFWMHDFEEVLFVVDIFYIHN